MSVGRSRPPSAREDTGADLQQVLQDEDTRVPGRDEEMRDLRRTVRDLAEDARRYKEEMMIWKRLAEEGEAAARERSNVLARGFNAQGRRLQNSGKRRPHAHQAERSYDAISEWDVIQDVRDLNDSLAEYAAHAANDLEFGKVRPPNASIRIVEKMTGKQMTKILSSVASGGCESIGVQIALQAVFTRVLSSTLELWSSEPNEDAMLQDIWSRISQHESRAASAQWKALTKRHTAHLHSKPGDLSHKLRELADHVYRAAGGQPELVPTKLAISLRGQVEEIVRLFVQLRSHIGEDTSFIDLEPIAPDEGDEFSHELMTRVDTITFQYGHGMGPPKGKTESSPVVLCTTALGLKRRDQGKAVVKAKVVQEVFVA